jgi:hypothetical protein
MAGAKNIKIILEGKATCCLIESQLKEHINKDSSWTAGVIFLPLTLLVRLSSEPVLWVTIYEDDMSPLLSRIS